MHFKRYSTRLVAPPVAPIAYETISYINANTTQTDGLDLGVLYKHTFAGIGQWKSPLSPSASTGPTPH
jgi:hypothetical protein